NIPGVTGIGPKTAVKLVNSYGSLERIYENLDKNASEKLKQTLAEGKEKAFLSRDLATLRNDLRLDIDKIFVENSRNIDISKVRQVFESLEFKTLIKRLPGLKGKAKPASGQEPLKTLSPDIKPVPVTCTTNFREMAKDNNMKVYMILTGAPEKPEGIMLYFGKKEAYPISWKDMKDRDTGEKITGVMEDEDISKSGFDFKAIYKVLKKKGINLGGKLYDYRLFYLILNPLKADVSLGYIAQSLLKTDIRAFIPAGKTELEENKNDSGGSEAAEVNLSGNSQLSMDFEDTRKNEENNARDLKEDLHMALGSISLYPSIEKELVQKMAGEDLEKVYWEIEEPLLTVLTGMELKGVAIDLEYLSGLIDDYDKEIKSLTGEIYRLCGETFNINSSQQLSGILYKKMKLPVVKKTKTGLSTDASSLQAICGSHPVIDKILRYREKTKLKNTYIDVLPVLVDKDDGRVHTTYHQLGTTTGRISSSDPNLQNIPIRTEYGKQIRKAFIPGKGYDLLLASDYSQIELRVLAHLSGDENLIDAFKRDEDIHTRTASEIFGIKYDEVGNEQRRMAKTINFGIIYGMTEYGLAARLSISDDEARDYIDRYFKRYSGVKQYIKSLIDSAYRNGYSSTMFGRKRYIRELGSSNGRLRSLGERFAVNTPIQGSAADIMKIATVALYKNLENGMIDSNIILQVHDELVLEIKSGDEQRVKRIVKDSMENCVELRVKLKVDMATGGNWYI
ncbi:MAG: DNA polymerase I, partial [Actinobacteria bacterium]|nr:DNA polymerase I [Actinomycetota bacterium]